MATTQSRFTFPAPASSGNNTRQSHSPVHHYTPTFTSKGQSSGNAHPYAIRTTSTALLTRSNSITQDHAKHHYVPPSPRPDHTSHTKDHSFGRAHGSGHRYSRSLSNDLGPRPLPSPPMASAPSFAPVEQGDLPANPKHWSPTQLSTYLTTALRVRGGAELPAPIAQDISTFVLRAHINGKAFLRLTENDLQGYHINPLWRTSLLSASRNLRQNVLKGRIWGLGGGDQSSPESPTNELHPATTKSRFISPKAKEKKPRYSDAITTDPESLYESAESSGSLDLSYPPPEIKDTTPRSRISGRFKNGRVKGMVQSWEVRTASENGSASESSGAEDNGEHLSDMGTVKRVLPAPPIPAPNFTPRDTVGTITPDSSASSSPSRPLPAPPLLLPTGTMQFTSSSAPLTPPLHISNPPDEELSMEDLLKMNGIHPERTRVGKRKAARAKAVHPQLNHDADDNEEEGLGPGVEAWLAPDGVTVKKIGSGGSGRKTMMRTSGLEDLFEAVPPVTEAENIPAAPDPSVSTSTDAKVEQELESLRQALAETEELACRLAARLEEYEDRVVQMGMLEEEIALEKKKETSGDDASGVNSSLSDATLADEEGQDEDVQYGKKVVRLLREENEQLKKKIEVLEQQKEANEQPPNPPTTNKNTLVARAMSLLLPFTSAQKNRAASINKAIEDHLRVRSLPGYLVLVGIGVCVVCLKVLGRRFVGKAR